MKSFDLHRQQIGTPKFRNSNNATTSIGYVHIKSINLLNLTTTSQTFGGEIYQYSIRDI